MIVGKGSRINPIVSLDKVSSKYFKIFKQVGVLSSKNIKLTFISIREGLKKSVEFSSKGEGVRIGQFSTKKNIG